MTTALLRQRGAAAMLLVLMLAIGLTTTLLGSRQLLSAAMSRQARDQDVLRQSKAAILAYLGSPDIDTSAGRRLGEWRLFPDLPIASGTGNDLSEPSYDGFAETGGCAWRDWSVGQPMRSQAVAGATMRCVGRLPWRDLPVALDGIDLNDPAAEVPWLVVSPNLATSAACLPDLTPLGASLAYIGFGCSGNPPYPWISVVDERGNLLSNRVAIVLLAPGPPTGGQVRGVTSAPSAYLDRVTIGPGCPQPCQPGTYDNALLNQPDNQPMVLIRAPSDARTAERLGYFASPYQFNDRLIFITIDELMATMERRARLELSRQLQAFRSAHGFFPYAASFGTADGACASGLRFGHPAMTPGNCGAGQVPTYAGWFTASGWHRYYVYAASARCVASNTSCVAPGLTVDANNAVNALTLAPGAPITTPPYAASRGAAQLPLQGFVLSALPANYLDSVVNAGATVDVFQSTQALPAPSNDRLEIVN